MFIKLIIWSVIMAIIHALWEIQIEGTDGWARKLPTFRINVFISKLLFGKELTGYHIFMLLLFVTIFHAPFLFADFSFKTEMIVIGFLSCYFVLEDFLWFCFNKHYTIKRFKKGKISWHRRWAFGLPVSYWWGTILGISLIYFGYFAK